MTDVKEQKELIVVLMVEKLGEKSMEVVRKAVDKEGKVIFKWRDVEDKVVKGIATHNIIDRVMATETMKEVVNAAKLKRKVKI